MDSNEKDSKQKMPSGKMDKAGGRKAPRGGIQNKRKPRNPNLRLVKNGDLPAKGKKKPEKKTQPGEGKFRAEEKNAPEDRKSLKVKFPGEESPKEKPSGEEAGQTKGREEAGKKTPGKEENSKKKNKKQPQEDKNLLAKDKKKLKKEKNSPSKDKEQPDRKRLGKKQPKEKRQEKENKIRIKEKGKQKEEKELQEKGQPEEGKRPQAKEKGKLKAEKGSQEKGRPEEGERLQAKEKGKLKAEKGPQEKGRPEEGKRLQAEEKEQEAKGDSQKQKTVKKEKKGKKQPPQAKKQPSKDKKAVAKPKKEGLPAVKKAKPGRQKKEYQDKPDMGEWLVQNKSLIIIGLTAAAIVCVLVGIYRYIITAYEVTTVYVDGNVHYTNEEIMEMVMGGRYGNNSLYLAAKYKDKGIEGVPFVEKMDVNILSPDTIRISVYEKALAGYVEYLGRYMYFDRDGIVVESSEERTSGIPQVTGLKFDYVVLNDYLPVENDEIFKRILDITQLLNKYELMADKIFFDSTYDLTLFFDGIRVTLGSDSDIDQKIIHLRNILPSLEGKTGTLRMENYTEDTKNITFLQE